MQLYLNLNDAHLVYDALHSLRIKEIQEQGQSEYFNAIESVMSRLAPKINQEQQKQNDFRCIPALTTPEG
jgi:hypothetical protein